MLLLDADAIKRDPALGPGSTHSVDSTRLSTLLGLGWGGAQAFQRMELACTPQLWLECDCPCSFLSAKEILGLNGFI